MNYFRITAYWPKHDETIILDSNGLFEQKWEFSSFVVKHGFKVLNITDETKFIDINISRAEPSKEVMFLRARQYGKDILTKVEKDGQVYDAIKVDEKIYIPNTTIKL